MREEDSIQEVLDSVESKLSVGDSKWCDRDIQTLSKKNRISWKSLFISIIPFKKLNFHRL